MLILDVNVTIYAFRKDLPQFAQHAPWLGELVNGNLAFAAPDTVLSGFLRIVTHPRIFSSPSTIEEALTFAGQLRSCPSFTPILPSPRYWNIFSDLCRKAGVRGNLVPDAYLAAMAIDSGCDLITTDHDYSRFPDLRWRHPF